MSALRGADGRPRCYGRLLATPPSTLGGGPPRRGPGAPRRRPRRAAAARPLARRRSTRRRARCSRASRAPVLDIGCGPGRHVAALQAAGHRGLGIDLSPVAVRIARGRGADASCGSVFEHVPGAGSWGTALLLDGNIGIGGEPAALLARAPRAARARRRGARRARPAGRAGRGVTRVRLEAPGAVSEWFPWAHGRRRRASTEVAAQAGLARRLDHALGRALVRGPAAAMTPPGPVPPQLLALPAARPVADGGARLGAARAGDVVAATGFLSHAAYQPDLPRQRDRRPGRRPAAARSPGRPARPTCTRSRRACTSTSGSSRSRSCWRSCGRSSRGCSRGRRSPRPRRRSSGCRSRCSSRARCSSSSPA